MTGVSRERIQKVLARAGIGSRRSCEDLVRTGRVRVNGQIAVLGARIDPLHDEVEIDGIGVQLSPDLVYIALHKPAGVLSAARDTRGRPTVLGLVPPRPRVFSVGRLDLDTSGLLFLTNDGDFANRIAHPRYGVPKTYVAEVQGVAKQSRLARLTRGISLEDGPARAERVRVRAASGGRALVEIVVREGRNRLVRRMLAALELDVLSLIRTQIGPVRLGRLKVGEWRNLKGSEVMELRRSATP